MKHIFTLSLSENKRNCFGNLRFHKSRGISWLPQWLSST